jgi:hypothetical protein
LAQALLPKAGEFVPEAMKETPMLEMDNSLRSRRILTLFFALLSGISAISTAVVPAILHI